ncbi:DUF2884 family protein [Pseudoalteromonas luteoviolacea]|uniref:DUF2884 family protein n=1 Tax=Pseudoalteromonas luteoviolacea DSM 6061 TaxID=1365250 RepID=A0A162B091_9GAMM|nr:DUF2884 family protein [Pseudoalteromonas luteoviolacea]KZN40257.1 hypothetical protein N475_12380 [Pseudoalteromonas luteoviolacea DSM 6061]KZN57232.1 hypothetical protein N474_08505 [Pseudoalteromonas luteoviolacea CPMOR-2]MBE0387963.1 hypothetical protein [Pseudoalteromonas luteoviolacea DSM 6061]TQF72673.1 DUF2884 family protein [Pseudoalteromonas luteoviolacea]
MKNALLITAILSSTSALAHNDHSISFSNDNCQVEFQNNVAITPNEVAITTPHSRSLTIDANGYAFINGQPVDVTAQQQRALAQYADTLRVELPKVAEMATDAIKVAEVALDEVGAAFDLHGLDNLSTVLDDLNQEIHGTFYQQGSFVMGEQAFHDFSENFEHQFEERIEDAVKSAMFQSIGSLLVSIGTEMNNANGDMSAFEQRMENMGRQIEEKVTAQAKNLEQRAASLCSNFERIAAQETALSQNIPAMSSYSLMRYTSE